MSFFFSFLFPEMEVVLNQSQLEFIRGGDLKLQLEFIRGEGLKLLYGLVQG
jgi:hypothetical protein